VKKVFIFDLDGTLAKIDHRRPILENKENSNRWEEFYKACVNDEPNLPVIALFETLLASEHEVHIITGRSTLVADETIDWLFKNINWPWNSEENAKEWMRSHLAMRSSESFLPDNELKQEWLNLYILPRYSKENIVVFDDRDKVVKMWRDNGIACFQVALGDF
jgi:phosphoserine phosphatase